MINNAKKSASVDNAYGYIEAVGYSNSMSMLDSTKYPKIEDGENIDITTIEDKVKLKGTRPTSGTITVKKGLITQATLCINNYNIEYDGNEAKVNGTCSSSNNEEVVLKGDPILEKAKALVYENETCKTDGTTYNYMNDGKNKGCYIKGASTNNYVWYNGFMWRIMGINSDGTVRLITDENVTALPHDKNGGTSENYATKDGYIHSWLNDYFYGKLNNTKSIIKEGAYFCSETTNETSLTEGRTICTSGKEVTAKVGLISYDEYYLTGTSSSYLNIGQYFWTMTPYSTSSAWYVNYNGYANNLGVANANGVRPVINVSSTATITKGDGTASNYYVLQEDKNIKYTNKNINDVVTSGEYVKLEGKTYRVVSKEDDGIKLILDGYYEETAGTPYTMSYGSDNTFTLDSGIGQKLNEDVLTSLGLLESKKIFTTAWYQGDGIDYGFTYTDVLDSTSNLVEAKVGLIRVGEMLSGQSSTILTKKYEESSSYKNANYYWAMNKYTSTSNAWGVSRIGNANNVDVTNSSRGVRPVIKVKTDLTISGGNGTWNNPYEI